MNKNIDVISAKIYDLEMDFEKIAMLAEIIKNFGDFSGEVAESAEKMQYLAEILSLKCKEYKNSLCEIIPQLQTELNNK